MHFRILGPLEVVDGDRTIPVGRGKQRALLGLLLVHANEVVSRDRLIDALWGEQPPETAPTALHGLVSGLRRALAADGNGLLRTQAPGYVLAVEADQIDVASFERLVNDGREALADARPDEATSRLREALGLWRGRALADFEYEPFAQPEIARLDELRVGAHEDLVDAELARGRHEAILPELEELVARHPHRERLRGQLMLALYRAQRQADALEVYRDTRRVLREELGLVPGPELARLHTAILRQDLDLDAPVRPAFLRLVGAPARSPLRLVLVAVVGVTAVALGLTLRSGGAGVAPDSVAVIDPDGDGVAAEIRLGRAPGPIALGNRAVWVASADGRSVLFRLDPRTRAVRQTVALGSGRATGLAFGAGSVWVATGRGATRVSSRSGTVAARIDYRVIWHRPRGDPLGVDVPPPSLDRRDACWPEATATVAVAGGAAWLLCRNSGMARIDADRHTLRSVEYARRGPAAIAAGTGDLWIANEEDDTVARVDARTGAEIDVVAVDDRPRAVAAGGAAVWTANFGSDTVSKIAKAAVGPPRVVRTVRVGDGPAAIAVGAGAVWVACGDGTVWRIDPETGDADTIRIGGNPVGVAAGFGAVWVTVQRA